MSSGLRLVSSLLSVVFLVDCKDGSQAAKCVPGLVVECPCSTGQQGAQACTSAGTFGNCLCALHVATDAAQDVEMAPPDTGQGGSGGAASVGDTMGAGGTTNLDANTSAGGSTGMDGKASAGGSTGMDGKASAGGSTGMDGKASADGTLGPGETTDVGELATTGGATSMGGISGSGDAAIEKASTDGASTGGMMNAGGTLASGGMVGSGGIGTGGAAGTGGTLSSCQASATQCSDKGVQVCTNGQWGAATACSTGLICERFAPAGCADPSWAEWPMPNSQVDSNASAPNLEGYTDDGDLTITDNITGLMWQKEVLATTTYTWAQAVASCPTSRLAGYSDWRLPSVIELASIVDFGQSGPSINSTYFPSTPKKQFWSASLRAGSPSDAWYINFTSGITYYGDLSLSNLVRCVR